MRKWTRVGFQPNLPLEEKRRVTECKEHIRLSKEAAKEGMVLLKNEKKLLPLAEGTRLALFGKGSFDYVKGGGGSGDVAVSYVHNLYDGFKMQGNAVMLYEPLAEFYRENVQEQYRQGAMPGMTIEPELPKGLADGAKAFADVAIVVISRFSSEGWDRSSLDSQLSEMSREELEDNYMAKLIAKAFPEGDYFLTENEKAMLNMVKERFDRIAVVLNVGGIVDVSWIKNDDRISAALLGWQGGMEGGLAMAELLLGKGNPSGKLTDTFAASLDDYPSTENFHESCDYVNYTEDIYVGYRYFETIPGAKEKVIYPFGYGLSYTDFRVHTDSVWETSKHIFAEVHVTNTGNMAGKEVVQLYFNGPQGLLGNPALRLAAFEKTRLLQPGETQVVYLSFEKADMASYDDLGKIQKSAYILEKGIYRFYIGISVRDTEEAAYTFELTENIIVKQLSAHLVPTSLKERMLSDGTFEMLPRYECNDMNECAFEKLKTEEEDCIVPEVRWCSRRKWFDNCGRKQFIDVAEGKLSLDEFMAQLSDKELLHLLGGQPNTGVANTFGLGNLPEYGVPSVMTADGPAGLRLNIGCTVNTTAWPCATLLACTWNPALVWQVGKAGAKEVKENNLAVWLTPAVNIHRNPMCGRNFEYYSEDPLIAGKMGAAMVKGIQSQHIAASVKHFTANNKETNRKNSDSRVSERALREIYLKGFEIIVKEAQPWTIMSSYNAVNGHRTSESYELLTDILRGEWGFQGMVTTDWWTCGEHYKEIKAGNDLKMATGYPERVKKAMEMGLLGRQELEQSARRVLELILKID